MCQVPGPGVCPTLQAVVVTVHLPGDPGRETYTPTFVPFDMRFVPCAARTLCLAIRLSNMLAQALSAERSVSDGSTEENVDLIAAGLFRGAGPKHSDAPGFHLFNVIVHAATCASSTWLFRCVFAGEKLRRCVVKEGYTLAVDYGYYVRVTVVRSMLRWREATPAIFRRRPIPFGSTFPWGYLGKRQV